MQPQTAKLFSGCTVKASKKLRPLREGGQTPRGDQGASTAKDATLEFLGGRPSQFLAKGTAGRTDRHA